MKSTLPKVSTAALHGLVLLLMFALLIGGTGFAAARPTLAALLVFLFSLPYLAASVVTKRAHFLYATMLLGAVSYFMVCYALGAPTLWFPLLSVPLVVNCLDTRDNFGRPRMIYGARNVSRTSCIKNNSESCRTVTTSRRSSRWIRAGKRPSEGVFSPDIGWRVPRSHFLSSRNILRIVEITVAPLALREARLAARRGPSRMRFTSRSVMCST